MTEPKATGAADSPSSGESDLVAGCARGERDAFAAVHSRYATEVQRFLHGLRLGLSGTDVEDAVQEVFLRLFQGMRKGSFRANQGALKPYVMGIARHVALDLCRRPRHTGLEPGAEGDARLEPDRRAADAEERALVEDAMNALDAEARALLALRHMNKLKMHELAGVLSCSLPTARERLRSTARRFALELRARGIVKEVRT